MKRKILGLPTQPDTGGLSSAALEFRAAKLLAAIGITSSKPEWSVDSVNMVTV